MGKKREPERCELLDVHQVAEVLGVDHNAVYQWRKDEIIPNAITLNGRMHWRRTELLDWVCAGCPMPSMWKWTPKSVASYELLLGDLQRLHEDAVAHLAELNDEKAVLERAVVELRAMAERQAVQARMT